MNKEKKNNRRWLYFLVFVICVLVVIVSVVLYFMQGSVKIDGTGEIDVTESVICEGKNIDYPFFEKEGSSNSSVKVSILTNRRKLDTINFIYSLEYASSDDSERASANNHANLNKMFSEDNLSADSFDARFVSIGNKMQMTLFADAKKINGISAKYFLISGSHEMTVDTLTKNYNNQGLDCVINSKS